MSKKILMVLTAVLLVGMSIPAFAAVENVKVGGDISIYGVYRKNFDFTKDTVAKDSAGWLMTTTRVYVSSELTDNVEVVIRLINERDWDVEIAGSTNIDLDLAYIKLSDMFVPGLSATLGRQEIILGEGFIIGDLNGFVSPAVFGGDLSARLSTDALRFDYKLATVPLTLTGFVAKIIENYATVSPPPPAIGIDTGLDQDLYGINANYQVPTAEAEVEGYFVSLNNAHATKNSANELSVQTFGARVAHEVAATPGFSWKGEFAGQWGKTAGLNNKGYAGYLGAEYAFQDIAWEPKVGLTYYHFSSDNDATDNTDNAWNPLFPDAAGDRIGAIVDASGLGATGWGQQSNMQVIKLSGSIQPTEKISISLDWFNDQLVKPAAGEKKELGNEIDLNLGYAYSEDVEFGLTFGYFVRGSAIKNAVADSADAMQIIGSVAVAF